MLFRSVLSAFVNSLASIDTDFGSIPRPYTIAGIDPADLSLLDYAEPVSFLIVASRFVSIISLRII